MKPLTLSTSKMANYLGISKDFLLNNRGKLFIEGVHYTNPQNKSNIYFGRKRAGKDEGRGGKEKVNVRVVLYFGIKIILIEVK